MLRPEDVGLGDLGWGDWDRRAPLSMGRRLVVLAEVFGGLALVIIAVGVLARASDVVVRFLVG